ncbi:hypothetical protein LCGC14_2943990, partial [marine sediment metagenome]
MDESPSKHEAKFDRVRTGLEGLPGIKMTRPATVIDAVPIIQENVTYVMETWRTEASGFLMFLQIVDSDGRARFILPNRVLQAIYRQRDRLTDRSTPESRARKKR